MVGAELGAGKKPSIQKQQTKKRELGGRGTDHDSITRTFFQGKDKKLEKRKIEKSPRI